MRSDELEMTAEPKDRTKWMWFGVLVVFAAAVGALWLGNRSQGDKTIVRAQHILIKCNKNDPVDRARALDLINDLRGRLQKGGSFSALAKEFSNDEGSASRGGDLGYYPRNTFEPDFENYVWSAPLGQLSDVIQTSNGFHLVVVLDRHVSKADTYEREIERRADDKGKAENTPGTVKP